MSEGNRRLVLHSLSLESLSGPKYITELQIEGVSPDVLKNHVVTIKEGAEYRISLKFTARDIIYGLNCNQVVKQNGKILDKKLESMGSFSPQVKPRVVRLEEDQAPSGAQHRGTYSVLLRLMDDDRSIYAELEWSFKIAQDW